MSQWYHTKRTVAWLSWSAACGCHHVWFFVCPYLLVMMFYFWPSLVSSHYQAPAMPDSYCNGRGTDLAEKTTQTATWTPKEWLLGCWGPTGGVMLFGFVDGSTTKRKNHIQQTSEKQPLEGAAARCVLAMVMLFAVWEPKQSENLQCPWTMRWKWLDWWWSRSLSK